MRKHVIYLTPKNQQAIAKLIRRPAATMCATEREIWEAQTASRLILDVSRLQSRVQIEFVVSDLRGSLWGFTVIQLTISSY